MAFRLGCQGPGGLTHVHLFIPADILSGLGWSWLRAVPFLARESEGMVSSHHICQNSQFGPGVTLPQAGQFPLRQVPVDLDGQGQPMGSVYVHSPFSTFDLLVYNWKNNMPHNKTHHPNWAQIHVFINTLPLPEGHREGPSRSQKTPWITIKQSNQDPRNASGYPWNRTRMEPQGPRRPGKVKPL